MRYRVVLIALASSCLLAGCASGPGFALDAVNAGLKPAAAARADADAAGQKVLWGGRIIQVVPGPEHTTLEVVSFPLRRNQQPDTSGGSEGRFLMWYPGYLEPEDYQAERLVTVVGTVREARTGQVGEAEYRYPVIVVDELYLWPEQRESASEPRVRFGLGIGIMR
ncbi:MAG: Slp family lipoprotein [Bacteroidales bacterium]|nr:Slp family lipoprotein [Bacteroidales bacterium]